MEIWDKSDSSGIVIYKFKIGYMTYLAEVDINTKRLMILRDYDRYMQDLPEDKLLTGELEYNKAYKQLKNENLIS